MKLVFAPDSFKGSLSARQAAECMASGARRVFPGAECVLLPMADGGEGTLDALLTACGGERKPLVVCGPDGEKTQAALGRLKDGAAVVEMALCSGLPMMHGKLDPLKATSFGTGEALLQAARLAQKVLVGIGGSATNDGGMGLLCALGAVFYDENGQKLHGCGENLSRVRQVDLSGLDAAVLACDIQVLCDVENPLLGSSGATYIYGPQKGADEKTLPVLEAGMKNYAEVLRKALGRDVANFPGAGAAGGVGAALCGVLQGKMLRGAQTVLDVMRFDEQIGSAALCLTGEGRMDGQSIRYGKAPAAVAARCQKQKVPCLALVGGLGEGGQEFCRPGQSVLPLVPGPMALEQCIQNAAVLMADAAERALRIFEMGRQ